MRTTTFITTLFAITLLLAPLATMAQGQQRGGARDHQQSQQRAQVERGQRDTGDRLRDRGRITDPAHDRDRDRDQDRTHAPDDAKQAQYQVQAENQIYGYELMSEEERNQYRERIRKAENRQEAEQIEAQHRHEMQVRARNKGVQIEEPVKARKGKDQ
jgi:UPF0716 family protein affecting phage T7 exclusion